MNRYERKAIRALPMFDTKEQALAAAKPFYGNAAEHNIAQYVGGRDTNGNLISKWAVELSDN